MREEKIKNGEDFQQVVETLQSDVNVRLADHSAIVELARQARRMHFARGEYVFKAGDHSSYFCLVESGRVLLSRDSSSGKAFTFLLAVRGMPLNAIACFRARAWLFSARVIEDADIIAIPSPVFRKWVNENPQVAIGILNTMGDQLDGAYTRILDLIGESVERRILNALSMLSSRIGPDLPLTNNDVAEMAGTSRETAARVISRLQESGLIAKTRGALRVLNKEELDSLSTSQSFIL